MREAMAEMMQRHGDIFTGVRQKGVILGLEFGHAGENAVAVSRALYEHGVWAIFSSLDKRVLQWKPGVLSDPSICARKSWTVSMPPCRARANCCTPRKG